MFQGKHKGILGTTSHGTHWFQGLRKITLHKCLNRLKAGLLRNCPRDLLEQSHVYLGALSKLDEFLLNQQTRILSGTFLGTSRNNDLENWEPTVSLPLSDLYAEVEFSTRQKGTSVVSSQVETSHNIDRLENTIAVTYSYDDKKLERDIGRKPFLFVAKFLIYKREEVFRQLRINGKLVNKSNKYN